jgi:acyl-homoserine lactone synthase
MLTTEYAHLCESTPPSAADIWEASRCCVSPDVPFREQSRLRALLRIAIAEFGAFQGIRHYISVTPVHLLPEVLASGWDAKPLGLPQMIAGASMGALLLTLTSRALSEARDRLACQMSVLEFSAERAT